jgi:4-amino-4-deoxy-L-arabinose transferase-like glycosyltransferase
VALVVATVKRWFRPGAALLAGLVLATTPVAALMFRFNNPDALLMLLLCGAAYAVTRAVEHASWRWLTFAGSLVGFAFLAKMLQSFLVLPAFALVYLVAAPTTFWRRIGHLASMGGATIVAAGWWVAIVELWPASSRPYIGGSQENSVMELVLGYNGLGRLTGNETGSVGGAGPAGTGQWGPTGWFRMFNSSFGGQVSWLLPASLLLLLAGLVWTLRRPRTDRERAGVLLWGGWLLATGITFSLSKGIIHEYYTVALAPAIGALVGIGASMAWDRREHITARMVMAVTVVATAVWTWVLLGRTTDWHVWLQPTVLALGVVAAVLLLVGDRVRRGAVSALGVGAVLAVGAGLAAPIAASATTIATPHSGAIVTAGPSMGGGFGPGGMGGPGGPPTGGMPTGGPPAGAVPAGGMPSGGLPAGVPPSGGFPGGTPPGFGGGAGGGMGNLLQAGTPSAEVVDTLTTDADRFDWVVATVGAMSGAGYQLATGEPVLAIGGFNGSDPSPTLAEFQQMVADGRIHYFAGGGMGGPMGGMGGGQNGGSNASAEITEWVTANFTATTVDGVTLYDLTN